jgi:hypothetical protein
LSVQKIDIVAPFEKLCQEAQKRKRKMDAEYFHQEVICKLSDLLFDSKTVVCQGGEFPIFPELFSFCQGHSTDDNCICLWRGIKISISIEEFYDHFHLIWEEKFKSVYVSCEEEKYSQAPLSKEDEKLFCAFSNFGHHSDGVILKSVSDIELCDSVLFFYQNVNNLSEEEQKEIQKILENKKLEQEKENLREEENNKKRKLLVKQVKQQELEVIKEIFKS